MTESLKEPIIVLSDLHLHSANWERKLQQLRGLWRDAGTVVFNGDVLNWDIVKNEELCSEVLAHIRDICAEDDTEPIIMGGNTDFLLPGPRHLFLHGGKTLIFHGDALFPRSSPWRINAKELGEAKAKSLSELQKDLTTEDTEGHRGTRNSTEVHRSFEIQMEASLAALQQCDKWSGNPRHTDKNLLLRLKSLSDWVVHPWRGCAVIATWMRLPTIATRFLDTHAPDVRALIFGHAHHRGTWRRSGRFLANTGTFESPGKPLVVRISDGTVDVFRVKHSTDEKHYSLGKMMDTFSIADGGVTDETS